MTENARKQVRNGEMSKEEHRIIGLPMVLLAAVLWGSMGLWVRSLNKAGLGSMEITFFRCLGMVVLLGIYGLVVFAASGKRLYRIRLRDLWCFLGTGLISILFFNYCYMTTISRTSLSVAALLLYTSPAFVLIFSALCFSEKMTGRKYLALFMALAGCVCVSGILTGGVRIGFADFFIGIGAGLGYGLYSIFSRFALLRGYSSVTISFYTFLIAGIGILPMADWTGALKTAAENVSLLPYALGLIVLCTLIPYLSYTAGLSRMENGSAAIAASVEPVAATVLGFVLYHEAVGLPELLGIFLILGSTVVVNLPKRE